MKSLVLQAFWLVAVLLPIDGLALDVPPIVSYSFTPSSPTPSDVVQFRMDVEGCYHHPFGAFLLSEEAVIEARITGEDFPCDPSSPVNFVTPRFYDVGQLPAGVYATRVLFCVPGPPEYICETLQEGTLIVSGVSGPPSVIPTLSAWALGLFAGMVLFAGLVGLRRG